MNRRTLFRGLAATAALWAGGLRDSFALPGQWAEGHGLRSILVPDDGQIWPSGIEPGTIYYVTATKHGFRVREE